MAIVLITGSCGLVGSESSEFFANKGFDIVGIDNNLRRSFFGKDGDINWIKNKLKKNIKNYKHLNTDIRDYKSLVISSNYYSLKGNSRFRTDSSCDWLSHAPRRR